MGITIWPLAGEQRDLWCAQGWEQEPHSASGRRTKGRECRPVTFSLRGGMGFLRHPVGKDGTPTSASGRREGRHKHRAASFPPFGAMGFVLTLPVMPRLPGRVRVRKSNGEPPALTFTHKSWEAIGGIRKGNDKHMSTRTTSNTGNESPHITTVSVLDDCYSSPLLLHQMSICSTPTPSSCAIPRLPRCG
jgi:hypothetical protein